MYVCPLHQKSRIIIHNTVIIVPLNLEGQENENIIRGIVVAQNKILYLRDHELPLTHNKMHKYLIYKLYY